MDIAPRTGLRSLLLAILLAVPVTARAEAPPPSRPEKWAWQPYEVTIVLRTSIEFEGMADWWPRYQQSLRDVVRTTFGPLWSVHFALGSDPTASRASPDEASSPSPSPANPVPRTPAARAAIPDDILRKRFSISLERRGSSVQLSASELDEFTQTTSHTVAALCADPDRLDWATVDLLIATFRPVALIEPIRGGGVSVVMRGERLWPAQLPSSTSRPCEVFYRYLNKSRVVEAIQPVPFTWILHQQTGEGAEPVWQVASGLRSPLAGRRQRVDIVGLAVGPLADATRLTLQSRRSAARKLAGLDVFVNHPDRDEPERLISDRAGQTVLTTGSPAPPFSGNAAAIDSASSAATPSIPLPPDLIPLSDAKSRAPVLTTVEVRSGKSVLARIPLVAGAHRQTTLELQDDTLRLNVEGDLAILQAAVIDAVSRRAVVMARIRRDARLGLWPAVKSGLKELDSLPNLEKFRSDLAGLQLPAQSLARADRDRQTESRIKRMCQETAEMMARFLSEEPVVTLRGEINDLETALRDAEMAQKRADDKKAADAKAAEKKAAERRAAPIPKSPPGAPKPGTGL